MLLLVVFSVLHIRLTAAATTTTPAADLIPCGLNEERIGLPVLLVARSVDDEVAAELQPVEGLGGQPQEQVFALAVD